MVRPASLAAVAAAIIVAVSGCSDDVDVFSESGSGRSGPGSRVTAEQLDRRSFSGDDVTGHELVGGTTITLSFDGDRLSSNAGCNTTSSGFRIESGRLVVDGAGMSTLIGCPPELEAQDRWLSGFLADGPELALGDDTLTLTSADGGATTVTLDEGADAAALVGTTWLLNTIIDGDTASAVPAEVEQPSMTIGEDGMAELFFGCNRGGAAVGTTSTGRGDLLTFGPIRSTKMACGEDASAVEATVLAVLGSEPAFTITADALVLTAPDGTALEFVAA